MVKKTKSKLLHLFDQEVESFIAGAHRAIGRAMLDREHGRQTIDGLQEAGKLKPFHLKFILINHARVFADLLAIVYQSANKFNGFLPDES